MELKDETINYRLSFDFTTVKGDQFIGRNGRCDIYSNQRFGNKDRDDEELIAICWQTVQKYNPKWKIFTLTITSIEAINSSNLKGGKE